MKTESVDFFQDKEKEITQYGPYKTFLGLLPNLMNAERFYINLGFVTTKNKIFMRKDVSATELSFIAYIALDELLHCKTKPF